MNLNNLLSDMHILLKGLLCQAKKETNEQKTVVYQVACTSYGQDSEFGAENDRN